MNAPLLLKNLDLYAPEHRGICDVLIVNGAIAAVGSGVEAKIPGLVEIDAEGSLAAPGIIDHHNHFNGAGGEGGPNFRTPPAQLSAFVKAGITTAVGLLGTDGYSRSLEELLAKSRSLEIEGLSTWIYTGSYQLPGPTLTGSAGRDLTLIDKVIGCKMALSDHRSSHPSVEQIRALVCEMRVAGMLAGKRGIVCVHMGSENTGLNPLREALSGTEVPLSHFMPTHVARNADLLDDAIAWTKEGGVADITVHEGLEKELAHIIDSGADLDRFCLSSDGNGSMPKFDAGRNLIGMGIGDPASILDGMVKAIRSGIDREKVFACASANPARWLQLPRKGRIAEGFDADLMILNGELRLDTLIGRGRLMMHEGKVLVKGTFE